ncbi:MAG TPA: nicotinate-nucleotide adenylyltransferase [Deltaproteobacteria bacterium]|nr:nicotinate-nucleotide adenylyltransferase [Deltaproteobacteria bacterium]
MGIFGGTFNPIHFGHLRAAEEVRQEIGLDTVFFVPSYIPPHKELAGGIPADKRLEIVRLAIRTNPSFALSSFEVEQGGSSYSIRTIEHVREAYGVTPYFILGQDAFNEISTWYQSARLFGLAHFVVMSRPDAKRPGLKDVLGGMPVSFEESDGGYVNDTGNRIMFVNVTALDISSSLIRSLRRQGRSIRYLVPEEVEDYIRNERMYE